MKFVVDRNEKVSRRKLRKLQFAQKSGNFLMFQTGISNGKWLEIFDNTENSFTFARK